MKERDHPSHPSAAAPASVPGDSPRQASPAPAPGPGSTRSLVLWSGGLDSTYSLVRLLASTEDEIYAHHVHLNVRREDGDEGDSCFQPSDRHSGGSK